MILQDMITEVSASLEDVANKEFSQQEIRDYLNDAQLDLTISISPALLLNTFHEEIVAFLPADKSITIPTTNPYVNMIRFIHLRVGSSSLTPERVVPVVPEGELRAHIEKQSKFPSAIHWIKSMVATIDGTKLNIFHNGNIGSDTTANAYISFILEPVHLYEGLDEPDIGGQFSSYMIQYAMAMCYLHDQNTTLAQQALQEYFRMKEEVALSGIEEARISKQQISQEEINIGGTNRQSASI